MTNARILFDDIADLVQTLIINLENKIQALPSLATMRNHLKRSGLNVLGSCMMILFALHVTSCRMGEHGGDKVMLRDLVEVDDETGAKIYLLGADKRPADHIYGEQPYSDLKSRRIAIRYYPDKVMPGGIEVFDLYDGSRNEVLTGDPLFPTFHSWSNWLYYREIVDGIQMLRRCNYLTMEIENVAQLPSERGNYSYGTVSRDGRWYAVSVIP